MTEKTDRRIAKSRRQIQTAFLTMLLRDGFDQIAVKAIAAEADISRKTFYLHYKDKYDLLDSIVKRQLEELERICEQKKETGFIEGVVIWFRYFEGHKEFFTALFLSESTVSFRKQLLGFIMEQFRKALAHTDPRVDREVVVNFLSNGVLGMVESYAINPANTGTQRMAEQVGALLEQTIRFVSLPDAPSGV